MRTRLLVLISYTLLAGMLAGCASGPTVTAPDTTPGDQIMEEYLIGEWCTNRDETANANQAAGLSGLLNVSPVFWRFGFGGVWDVSVSGFLFESHGSWRVDNPDKLLLGRKSMEPEVYSAQFMDGNLFLTDDKGQFTVLSRCD
jgi:hypothetical protein